MSTRWRAASARSRRSQQCDYALVLMDIQMPGMNGFDAAMAIRAGSGRAASVPILAFTALSAREAAERLEHSGMDGYIPKPFTAPMLLEAVEPWRPSGTPHRRAALVALFGEAEINAMVGRFREQLADALATRLSLQRMSRPCASRGRDRRHTGLPRRLQHMARRFGRRRLAMGSGTHRRPQGAGGTRSGKGNARKD